MSVTFILGLPGGGKSYTVMKNFVLPAMKKGRRVLHNVPGLKDTDEKAFYNFGAYPRFPRVFQDKNTADFIFLYPPDESVEYMQSDCLSEYCQKEGSGWSTTPPHPVFMRGGDVVIMDEFLIMKREVEDTRDKLKRSIWLRNLEDILRAHRHFVQDGKTCDIVIIAQISEDIPSKIFGLAELTYVCSTDMMSSTKGFWLINWLYKLIYKRERIVRPKLRLRTFAGAVGNGKRISVKPLGDVFYRPDPAVFKLYHSYTGGVEAAESFRGFGFWALMKGHMMLLGVVLAVIIYTSSGFMSTFVYKTTGFGSDKVVAAVAEESAGEARELVKIQLCRFVVDGNCLYFETIYE